jgi:hypothetical protein
VLSSVAVLSDIHAVLPALDAVLADPALAAAERIVLTGDIAAGPQPVEVLDRLLGLGDRVVWVRGNADRELVTLAAGGTTEILDPIATWAAAQLPVRHLSSCWPAFRTRSRWSWRGSARSCSATGRRGTTRRSSSSTPG